MIVLNAKAGRSRSAGFQPAVSPTSSRQGVRRSRRQDACETADWKSALRRAISTPRAAPSPIFRRGAQTCLDGIVNHVPATSRMFRLVTNPVVKRLRLPKPRAATVQQTVGARGRELFPTFHNVADSVIGHRPEHGVDVIRHHHPGIEPVALVVEKANGFGNQVGNVRSAQRAFADAGIQIPFDLARVFPLNVFGFGRRTVGIRTAQACGLFRKKPQQHFLRQRVGEPKRDEVSCSFPLYVRQVSPRMNAAAKRIDRLGLDARGAQLVMHPFQLRIAFRRTHGDRVANWPSTSNAEISRSPGSAGFQPAVSRVSNPLAAVAVRNARRLEIGDTAGWETCATPATERATS